MHVEEKLENANNYVILHNFEQLAAWRVVNGKDATVGVYHLYFAMCRVV